MKSLYFDRVDHVHRYAVLDSGEICKVTNLFDEDGDEIAEDETDAKPAAAVVKLPNGKWASLRLDTWDQPTVH